jgi:hypothetical protein
MMEKQAWVDTQDQIHISDFHATKESDIKQLEDLPYSADEISSMRDKVLDLTYYMQLVPETATPDQKLTSV